jgi:outer membrane protease
MSRRLQAVAVASCVVAASTGASAQSLDSLGIKVTTEMSIGLMTGKAQEFVYNPNGSVLSRLDWRYDNIAMLNTHTAVRVFDRVKLGLKGSFNLTESSKMDDYDFNLPGCPPAAGGGTLCHSWHPETKLRQAYLLDIYASYDVFKSTGFTVSALAGYKHDFYRWAAIGGDANYGPLPPGIGITYEQTWSTAYVGLGFVAEHGTWTLRGRAVGSGWAKGDDRDDHHLRSLTFTDKFDRTTFFAADIGVAYRVTPNMSITADYGYQRWGTGKGPTTILDRTTGATGVIPGDAAGGNSETHMVSLGVLVQLQRTDDAPASVKEGPTYAPGPRWTGYYAGAVAGTDWQQADWRTTGISLPPIPPVAATATAGLDSDGQRGGVFLGGQMQFGQLVAGIEIDASRSNANEWTHGIPGTGGGLFLAAPTDVTALAIDASARLRLGYLATPSLLIYATGGLAAGQMETSLSYPGNAVSWCVAPRYEEAKKLLTGWTLGAGYDWALGDNWFTRGEYRYTDLGTYSHTFFANAPIDAVTAKIDSSNHRLTFGLGYRF